MSAPEGGEGLRVILVTAPSTAEARRLVSALVAEGAVACGNIVPGLTSIYRWEGRIEENEEVLIILKTTDELVEPVIGRVEALHSYETPEVIVLPVAGVLERYGAWIRLETTEVES